MPAVTCEVVCDSRTSSRRSSRLRSRTVQIVLAFAAIYLVWGSTFLGIRIAILSIPPGIMAGLRWCIAGGLLYVVLRLRGACRPSARDWRTALLVGGGIIFGGNGSVTYAERFIPSGTAAVIVAIVPALTALLGWLSGITARPRPAVWLGILLATCGVVVIVQPGKIRLGSEEGMSLAILLAGELMWTASSLYAVRVVQRVPGLLMAAMQMLCGGALLLGTATVRGEFGQFNFEATTLSSLLAMAYLIAIGSFIGFSAYVWLLRNVEPTRVATYAYVNPIVAVSLGWLVLGEKIGPELLAGSAFVVIGIALIITFRSRSPQTQLINNAPPSLPSR